MSAPLGSMHPLFADANKGKESSGMDLSMNLSYWMLISQGLTFKFKVDELENNRYKTESEMITEQENRSILTMIFLCYLP